MNAVLDNFLVGVLLLASLGYALYKLGPRTLRKRILQAISRAMAAAPAFLKLSRAAARLTASAGTAGACGGCDNCGSDSSSKPQPSSAEIKVPVAKIGRRA